MKIKNLTSRVQALPIVEIVGGRDYTIYVEGNGSVELCECYVPSIDAFKGVFEVVRDVELTTPAEIIDEAPTQIVDETPLESTSVEDTVDSDDSEEVKEPEVMESKFICDICGAEFGSARGLSSHKNRVHSEDEQ